MAQVFISTGQPSIRRMSIASVATGTTAATYGNVVPTTTRPTTGIVLDANVAQGCDDSSLIKVMPFGVLDNGTAWATSGTTTGFRLVAWQSYRNAAGTATWWFPTILTQHTLLFGTGASALSIDGTNDAFMFSGSGAALTTPGFPAPNVYSPNGTSTTSGSNLAPASFLVDLTGAQLVTVDFICPAPGAGRTATMGLFWYAI